MATISQRRRVSDHPNGTGVLQFMPEFELLLACCAVCRADRQEKLRHFLGHHYDFAAFIRLAEEHRVIPQIYRALSAHSELLSDADLAMLGSAYEENARRALRLTGELLRLLRHFEGYGIEALPYKGPALAQALYGDVSSRQFFDLDIIVSPQDVGAAKAALAELGYVSDINLSVREEASFIASGYEHAFSGPAGPHTLELKWRILPRFYSVEFEAARLLNRAEQVTMGGQRFRTLHADDLLLVLCVHAAKHMWSQLSWLCDIAEVARSREIQWKTICEKAEQLGIRRIVAASLQLAHDLLGSDMPTSVQEWCRRDSKIDILSNQILCMISEGCPYDTESVAYFNFMLQVRERRQDKVRLLGRLLWNAGPGEWSAIHLPERLSFAYHFVRMGRLANRILGAQRKRDMDQQTKASVGKVSS
jgi:Uncharacterised nucleotidyltransferase